MTDFYGLFNFFDVAIPLRIPMHNGQSVKATLRLPITHPAAMSTIYVESETGQGTGVVIAKRRTPIFLNHIAVSSLALTAGHVVEISISSIPTDKFTVHADKKNNSSNTDFAYPVIDYSGFNAEPQFDPCNGNKYSLPNDLAIIALSHNLNSIIEEMELADDFDPSEQIYVAGYPSMPTKILYCSPFLKKRHFDEANKNLMDAFQNFEYRIISEEMQKCLL